MAVKKMKRVATVFATIAMACVLFMGLFMQTSPSAHAHSLATKLTITYIAVDDQNQNAKKAFTQGDQAIFLVYVHNPSNFPDSATLYATVMNGGGFTILNTSWNVTIPGNSTPGYGWRVTIPSNASAGIYYYHPSVKDSQGTVDSWAVFTVRNHISYNPFYPNYVSQCTWRAEDLMHTATGLYMPVYGNAGTWTNAASAQGWSVGTSPETSSVMVMQYGNGYKYPYWNGSQWVYTSINPVGHVGWVTNTGYNGAMVYIIDRNWTGNGQDGGRWIWISGAPVNFIYSSH